MFRSTALMAAAAAVVALAAMAVSAAAGAADATTNPDELAGGKVPLRVLIDNSKLRVSLLTFPQGYVRTESFARRSDQLIVYLDDAQLGSLADPAVPPSTELEEAGKPVVCRLTTEDCGPVDPAGVAPAEGADPSGSVSWRPQGAYAAPLRVEKGYRAIYIEFKHGTLTAPDPAAAKLPYEPAAGGGGPARVLIDNDVMRATLITFPQDFVRAGNLRRHYDTLIVYVDEGKLIGVGPPQPQYAEVQRFSHHPPGPPVCDPIKDCDSVGPDGNWSRGPHPSGTVAWHPKDGYVGALRAAQTYRAVYVELK